MRVVQVLPTIAFGDAVGNDVMALMDIILELGYETAIYADIIDQRLQSHRIFSYRDIPEMRPEDVLIYHMSTGSRLAYDIPRHDCKKIMIYHNITPPVFFKNYNRAAYLNTYDGRIQLKYLADKFDYALADSEYNKQELLELGYTCQVDVLPVIIPFDDYRKQPNKHILRKYSGNTVNLMFLGRVVPNKKHEDVLAIFYYYKKYFNPKARLFLIGTYIGMENYYERLQEYIRELRLKDVYFTNQVGFDEILAYYKTADAFICASEHEGFCVPLIEAMLFEVPIIAYASSAIPSTLAGTGILLQEREPLLAAGIIDSIVKDPALKKAIVDKQKARLKDLEYERLKDQFIKYLSNFLECGQ